MTPALALFVAFVVIGVPIAFALGAAALVGLADSVGQIRLVLRNPQDGALTNRPNISAAAIFAEPAPVVRKLATQSGASPVSAIAALRQAPKN